MAEREGDGGWELWMRRPMKPGRAITAVIALPESLLSRRFCFIASGRGATTSHPFDRAWRSPTSRGYPALSCLLKCALLVPGRNYRVAFPNTGCGWPVKSNQFGQRRLTSGAFFG